MQRDWQCHSAISSAPRAYKHLENTLFTSTNRLTGKNLNFIHSPLSFFHPVYLLNKYDKDHFAQIGSSWVPLWFKFEPRSLRETILSKWKSNKLIFKMCPVEWAPRVAVTTPTVSSLWNAGWFSSRRVENQEAIRGHTIKLNRGSPWNCYGCHLPDMEGSHSVPVM